MKRLSILIIEDVFDHLQGSILEFKRHGHNVQFVSDWQAASEYTRGQKFDVIVVDWRWPMEKLGSDGHLMVEENGGREYIEHLIEGKLGRLNEATPIWVFTVHDEEVERNGIKKFRKNVRLISKLHSDRMERMVLEMANAS
jgi:CheY-like chemotaxis protein